MPEHIVMPLYKETTDSNGDVAYVLPEPELTDSEKIEYMYQVAVKLDAAVREVLPQVAPILESVSKNPMLKMFMR
jgi:hypothetical protein